MPVEDSVRLLSESGAAFALVRVPDLDADRERLVLDVELLDPGRLVRYLAREFDLEFIRDLAGLFIDSASEPAPERTVPGVQSEGAGLVVSPVASATSHVTLEVLVVDAPDEELKEYDGRAFDVPRMLLVDAAHRLQEWCP